MNQISIKLLDVDTYVYLLSENTEIDWFAKSCGDIGKFVVGYENWSSPGTRIVSQSDVCGRRDGIWKSRRFRLSVVVGIFLAPQYNQFTAASAYDRRVLGFSFPVGMLFRQQSLSQNSGYWYRAALSNRA